MLGASITRDLENKNDLIVISALNSLCKLMFAGSAPAFIDPILKLIKHKNARVV